MNINAAAARFTRYIFVHVSAADVVVVKRGGGEREIRGSEREMV